MSSAPRLTVAMSVYNNAPFLALAIESVLNQTMGEFEFLIVNDGSTDGSGDIIDGYALRDPRIRAIHQENRGLVLSLNRLLSESRTDWFARMDGDDVCHPDRLAMQLARAAADPALGVIGCQMSLIDAAGNPLGPEYGKPLTHVDCLAALENKPLMNHNAVLLRHEAVAAIGGYRPAYRHAEDYDLWTRLIDRVRFANLPDVLVQYRVYQDQVSSRHDVEQITNAAIAWLAYCERRAGRPDPTEGLTAMPPLDQLDAMFGNGDAAAYVRQRIVGRVLYSAESLAGDGWRPLLDHVAETGRAAHLWRATARLARAGRPAKAARLAYALLRAG